MKKILLGTSALVGAAVLATSAQAAPLQITTGGYIQFEAGFSSQESDFEDGTFDGTANTLSLDTGRDFKFRDDVELQFKVEGKADNGLKYGAVIELQTDGSQNGTTSTIGLEADQAYAFAEGNWGRVEMGTTTGASGVLGVNAGSIASATGGIDGDWEYFVSAPVATTGAAFAGFVNAPGLVISSGDVTDGATKISYYSPRIAPMGGEGTGLQLGLSFTPDSGDYVNNFSGQYNGGDAEEVIDFGVNYVGQVGDIGFEVAGVMEIGDAERANGLPGTTPGREDLSAWEFGFAIDWQGFSFAASYFDHGDSLSVTGATISAAETDGFTAGVGYAQGPWSVSLTYMSATTEYDDNTTVAGSGENEFSNIVIGADYNLAPGFTPFVEVAIYDYDGEGIQGANTASDNAYNNDFDNDGNVILIGAELAF